jgi:uracil-DNA glycosylase
VPFLIHEPGARNRAPTGKEARDGLTYLPPLLNLMPRLHAVVCAGRFAQKAIPTLRAHRPDLKIVAVPHPSPAYVCTSPLVRERIMAGLHEARTMLEGAA